MRPSVFLSSLLLAIAASAADSSFRQWCYETCVHNTCNPNNRSTMCRMTFVSSYIHIEDPTTAKNTRGNAAIASICVMAPQSFTSFDRVGYTCQLST
ncbi:MAG: hypothetical protein J3R72DRAFT_449973 [Linnemannia gamsii]|nr:MAG: hypothetical protein J3R72DRAFT_449973 [Linnemannia gamsii]